VRHIEDLRYYKSVHQLTHCRRNVL